MDLPEYVRITKRLILGGRKLLRKTQDIVQLKTTLTYEERNMINKIIRDENFYQKCLKPKARIVHFFKRLMCGTEWK